MRESPAAYVDWGLSYFMVLGASEGQVIALLVQKLLLTISNFQDCEICVPSELKESAEAVLESNKTYISLSYGLLNNLHF